MFTNFPNKAFFTFSCLFVLHAIAVCQDTNTSPSPLEVIRAVKKSQEFIRTVSYRLERTDTLLTGTVRTMSGRALIKVEKKDSVFGFLFQAKKEGYHGESVYDGHIAYAADDDQKTYTLLSQPKLIPHSLGSPGGQIIMPDLISLDTANAVDIKTFDDTRYTYLVFHYADIKEYDVTKRSKTVTIDKKNMLPVAMRSRQETLGKVQDLYYVIKEIQLNDPSFAYNFSSPVFLKTYKQEINQPNKSLLSLKGLPAPDFNLASFSNVAVSTSGLRGKPVLLNFWEVWCGPCLESMPKVQQLYDSYKAKGLNVFGVMNDLTQLGPAKELVKKRDIGFPMLIGNEQVQKDFKVNSIPLYILIDKEGLISFISEGYSDELESAIKKIL